MAVRYKIRIKKCVHCDKEYQPTNNFQKYCPECRSIVWHEQKTRDTANWTIANPDRCKKNRAQYYDDHRNAEIASSKAWNTAHPERIHENRIKRYARQRETVIACSVAWQKANPEKVSVIRRTSGFKRRRLGFVPMNNPFEGCEAHHINQNDVIYMPKKLHRSISHNVWTGKNMEQINTLAGQYVTEDWT